MSILKIFRNFFTSFIELSLKVTVGVSDWSTLEISDSKGSKTHKNLSNSETQASLNYLLRSRLELVIGVH